MSYYISTTIRASFDEAISKTEKALSEQGFGVVTRIDMRETLKKKIGADFRPYTILGACNPPLAHQALSAEPSIGALLPCNVVLRQEGEAIVVDFMDPEAVLTLVERDGVAAIAADVRSRLDRVKQTLTS